jgi:hypothetical protein
MGTAMVPTSAHAKPVRRPTPATQLALIAENARVWSAAPVGAVIRLTLRGPQNIPFGHRLKVGPHLAKSLPLYPCLEGGWAWPGAGAQRSPAADDAPPAQRHDLTRSVTSAERGKPVALPPRGR